MISLVALIILATHPPTYTPLVPAEWFWNDWAAVPAGVYLSGGPIERDCLVEIKAPDGQVANQQHTDHGPIAISIADGQRAKATGCFWFMRIPTPLINHAYLQHLK
jgi:hypothetical protein